ncbi:MAG TPA: hypothetical protein VN832_03770 [Stellaceae bacterium]|nr:hypothetical protein [Stellaceae bacterium]
MKPKTLAALPLSIALAGAALAQPAPGSGGAPQPSSAPGRVASHSHPAVPLRQAARTSGDTPEARRTTDALNILEERGYAFSNFHAQGNAYVATATLPDGRQIEVTVNPDTDQTRKAQ